MSTPAGIDLGFVVSLDKRSIEFTPTVDKEGDFLVTLEATDNTGATAVSGINIKIRKKIEPEPTDFEIVGVIVGDIDTGSPGNKSMEIMAGPEVISAIPNGDLDYTESDSQDFIDDYDAKTGLKQKTKGATKGNHDAANEDGTDNNETQLSNYFGWQLQPTRLAISAYTEGNVGFIGMDSQDDSIVDTNGVQATFVKTKLEEFKNSGIDFVTICIHKPLYGTTYKHGDETAIRNAYQPIFDQYQVDVVVQAHNHQSWVTHPLRVGGNVEVEKTVEGYYDFAQQHGQIYCGGGAGGEGNYVIGSNVPSYVIFTNDNDYALVYVERNKVDNKLFRLSIVTHQGAVLYKQVIRKGPPAPLPLDAKFAELTKKAVKDSIVVCDGSKSTGGINGDAIVSWDIIQVNRPEEGVPLVTLTNHPTLKFSKQFVMPELDVAQAIKLQLNVTDNAANTDSDIMAVTEQKTPPAGDFPVPTEWFYNSKEVHDSPGHMESSSYYPNADSVCLPSGASGANNHQSQTDGWIDIDSGGGNGRLYWDYAKIAAMKAHAKYGKSISFAGVFKLQNGDNLSINDGKSWMRNGYVTDDRNWGGDIDTRCGGQINQTITWGGPVLRIEVRNIDDFRFDFIGFREIEN